MYGTLFTIGFAIGLIAGCELTLFLLRRRNIL